MTLKPRPEQYIRSLPDLGAGKGCQGSVFEQKPGPEESQVPWSTAGGEAASGSEAGVVHRGQREGEQLDKMVCFFKAIETFRRNLKGCYCCCF